MKHTVDDLAVFGGKPEFPWPLHVGSPAAVDRTELYRRLDDMLVSYRFTNDGPMVREFEERFADLCEVPYCVAVTNATVGLELVARALMLSGEVIVPSFTFVATAHAMANAGLRVVFADVDPATHMVAPESVVSRITKRTCAIVGVHLWGKSCDAEGIEAIGREIEIPVIFDAAQAVGCTHFGSPVARYGNASVFSLHATKAVHSFEGGMIATRDGSLADDLRRMRNFGFVGYDDVRSLGTNAKMHEASAAMGLTSLGQFRHRVECDAAKKLAYRNAFGRVLSLTLIPDATGEQSNHHYVVGEWKEKYTRITRDTMVRILHEENIIARRYFYPGVHRMEPYRSMPNVAPCPHTEDVSARTIALPTGDGVNMDDIDRIADLFAFVEDNATQIARRLEP